MAALLDHRQEIHDRYELPAATGSKVVAIKKIAWSIRLRHHLHN
jgi:hypothetical protein